MDLGLKNDTALITGAASGIGLATAQTFAQEGCSLLLWDISPRVDERATALRGFDVEVVTGVQPVRVLGDDRSIR